MFYIIVYLDSETEKGFIDQIKKEDWTDILWFEDGYIELIDINVPNSSITYLTDIAGLEVVQEQCRYCDVSYECSFIRTTFMLKKFISILKSIR